MQSAVPILIFAMGARNGAAMAVLVCRSSTALPNGAE